MMEKDYSLFWLANVAYGRKYITRGEYVKLWGFLQEEGKKEALSGSIPDFPIMGSGLANHSL